MLAGSKTARMIVASMRTAAARPTPNCFSRSNDKVTKTDGRGVRARKQDPVKLLSKQVRANAQDPAALGLGWCGERSHDGRCGPALLHPEHSDSGQSPRTSASDENTASRGSRDLGADGAHDESLGTA